MASVSPSPANVPPVIFTVADLRKTSSGSVIDVLGAKVTVLVGVPVIDEGTPASVGASLMKVTLTVEVAVPVEKDELPSLSVQVSVRDGFERELSGFSPALKVTVSSSD